MLLHYLVKLECEKNGGNLIKLLPYILFEKYIYILTLEMVSPGNLLNESIPNERHSAGSLGWPFPMLQY